MSVASPGVRREGKPARIRRAAPERRESPCGPGHGYAAVAGMAWARHRLLPARGDQRRPSGETGGAAPGREGPGAGRDGGGGGVRAERRPGRRGRGGMLGGTGPRGPGRGRLGRGPRSRPPRVGAARQGLSGTSLRVAARLISGDGEPHVGDALQGSDSTPPGLLLGAWDTCARLRPRPPRGPEREHHLTQDLPAGCHLRPRPHLSGQGPRPPAEASRSCRGGGRASAVPRKHRQAWGFPGGGREKRKGGVAAGSTPHPTTPTTTTTSQLGY